MSFRKLKFYRPQVCSSPIYLPEVQANEKGEIVSVMVCQSKNLPDSSTTKLSTQLKSGVPLKAIGSVMVRDVTGVPAALESALASDVAFNSSKKEIDDKSQNTTEEVKNA